MHLEQVLQQPCDPLNRQQYAHSAVCSWPSDPQMTWLEQLHSRSFLIQSFKLDPDKYAAILHTRPLLKETAGREHKSYYWLEESWIIHITPSHSKVRTIIGHKLVFEQRAWCLQTGRDMTTTTAVVSESVVSFVHIMCETRNVLRSSETATTHCGLWMTQRYTGTQLCDNARRKIHFQTYRQNILNRRG
jgi:hypothetical protein